MKSLITLYWTNYCKLPFFKHDIIEQIVVYLIFYFIILYFFGLVRLFNFKTEIEIVKYLLVKMIFDFFILNFSHCLSSSA